MSIASELGIIRLHQLVVLYRVWKLVKAGGGAVCPWLYVILLSYLGGEALGPVAARVVLRHVHNGFWVDEL
jgi:hypothetical protein